MERYWKKDTQERSKRSLDKDDVDDRRNKKERRETHLHQYKTKTFSNERIIPGIEVVEVQLLCPQKESTPETSFRFRLLKPPFSSRIARANGSSHEIGIIDLVWPLKRCISDDKGPEM
jgi:hypothetical protein